MYDTCENWSCKKDFCANCKMFTMPHTETIHRTVNKLRQGEPLLGNKIKSKHQVLTEENHVKGVLD